MCPHTNLAKILRDLIGNRSTVEVAKEAGVSQQVISKILTGKSINPSVKVLEKLAEYFNVTIEQLIGDEEITARRKRYFISHNPRKEIKHLLTRHIDEEIWLEIPVRVGELMLMELEGIYTGLDFTDLDLDDEATQINLKLLYYIWLWFRKQAISELEVLIDNPKFTES
ncbi:MAG: helix-turn-helix transcriptional regulator [bacterium]|nr:helix-turn-helix transcriptional regulator [bacterium]